MSYPPYYNLPIVLCEFFIALIAKEPYSALFPCSNKKNSFSFYSFFVEFVVECRFYSLTFYDICGGLGFIIVVLVV